MIITYGSLFAGIGGIDLGFDWAGLKCQWQVEKDPFCQKVLAKHWPDVRRFEDVKETGKHNLKPVDIIAGGFPCQPHSVAGKRQGAADDRDLWPEYRRIVAELKPTYVIGENVPGIKTTILDSVLSDLEDLDYTTAVFVIPACAHNAPHRRDRIWIVAYANNTRGGTPTSKPDTIRSQNIKKQQNEPFNGIGRHGKTISYTSCNRRKQMEQSNDRREKDQGTINKIAKCGSRRTRQKTEPGVGGTFDGVPAGVDRLRHSTLTDWSSDWEHSVPRVSNGVPNRMDRLRSLGNAVVPQQAYFIATLVTHHIKINT